MKKMNAKDVAGASANAVAWTAGSVIRLIARVFSTIILIVLTTGLLFACIFAFYAKNTLTELDINLEDFTGGDGVALSSVVYCKDSNGNYKEMFTLYDAENREWVGYDDIPIYLEYAAVSIEDKRFYEHKGVDWYRTVGAFGNMFLQMNSTFGGSTLTQQLLKNLTDEDDVTVARKLTEIFRALEFEKKYTKDQIVEWYLNSIYLGQGCYGIGTAAETYFGKHVSELSIAECATLIGITNNPSMYDPFISRSSNEKRAATIVYEMYDQGYISKEQYDEASSIIKNHEIVFTRAEDEDYEMEIRSWYEDVVIQDVLRDIQEKKGVSYDVAFRYLYGGGLEIYASIDLEAQAIVDSYYEDISRMPQGNAAYVGQTLQSAIVIMDPYNGEIVALSGGVGEKEINLGMNRATDSQRPPGSSIKPLTVYGPALEYGLITPNTMVNDSPNFTLSQDPTYHPSNSGGGHRGPVTVLQGVMSSLNTVSVQVLDKVGLQRSYEFFTENLGATSPIPDDIAYAPLGLGQFTNGITVREMAQAYAAFANDGIFTKARTYTHIMRDGEMFLDNQPEQHVAMKPNTAWNMTYILEKVVQGGTGTVANLGIVPTAGKTGTTTDDKDRYFCGYTPYYVAAVWTGFDIPKPIVYWTNPAGEIFRKIMTELHQVKGCEYKSFPQPTIGGATGIFGDMEPIDESPSPSPSDSPSPSPSSSTAPSPSDSNTPVTDTPTAPPVVTDTPTVPPVVTDTPTAPPVVTDPPIVTAPPPEPPADPGEVG